MSEMKPERAGLRFLASVTADLDAYLADPSRAASEAAEALSVLPRDVAAAVDAILKGKKTDSYRDGLMIQFGFGLVSKEFVHVERAPGGRPAAAALGTVLASRHISGVRDAYQNIGKNSTSLVRGNNAEFDFLLKWGDQAAEVDRRNLLRYVISMVSLTARAVLPMPELERPKLTFLSCVRFYKELFAIPSGGAYQQFAVAACLHALIDEFGQGGVNGLRVETKRINASDASSRVAGDVQIVRGNRVEESFEVTANAWKTKVEGAIQSARLADLQRIHIIADVEPDFPDDAEELEKLPVDLTVIGVETYIGTLLASMRKPAREVAFDRLYEFLDRLQPEIERTNDFVRLLGRYGFSTPPTNRA